MGTELLTLLALVPALLTVPGTLYLLLLSLAALLPRRSVPGPAAKPRPAPQSVVLLVPAHNESAGLLRTLCSLRAELRAERGSGQQRTRIVVVADNCSDDTARLARGAGVEVIERVDPQRRGKGHALHHAFERIEAADWFIVVDADTDVQPGFLAAMRAAMDDMAGEGGPPDALQCRYRVRDAQLSPRSALADVALGAWNVLRPRGRSALGLSAGILGNGFALSRRTLGRQPYLAGSIVEDAEYHLLLLQQGLRVRWVDDAEVRGDMPQGQAASAQRARWEGGRLRLLRERAPALLRGLLRGHWRLADALADLLLPPLSWQLSLLGLSLLAGQALDSALLLVIGAAGLGVLLAHVLIALYLIRAEVAHWRALAGVPRHLVWKLSLALRTWRQSGRGAAWERSPRLQQGGRNRHADSATLGADRQLQLQRPDLHAAGPAARAALSPQRRSGAGGQRLA